MPDITTGALEVHPLIIGIVVAVAVAGSLVYFVWVELVRRR